MMRSKKAIFGLGLEQTIGLVLAFIGILVIVAMMMGIIRMFTGPPDQGTINMYNRMFDAVEVMMNPANENDTCKITTGYIEPDFAIVGFNKEGVRNRDGQLGTTGDVSWMYIEEHCGIDDDVYKPDSCLESACLCVCNGGATDISGEDCSESSATCRRVSDDVQSFTTRYDGGVVDLVLYGENCWSGSNRGVIAGYVVKKVGNGGTISIEAVETNADMRNRYADTPECEAMVRHFRRGEAQRADAPEEQEGEGENTRDPTLAAAGADTPAAITRT